MIVLTPSRFLQNLIILNTNNKKRGLWFRLESHLDLFGVEMFHPIESKINRNLRIMFGDSR